MAWVLPTTVNDIVPKRAKLSFGLRAGDFDSCAMEFHHGVYRGLGLLLVDEVTCSRQGLEGDARQALTKDREAWRRFRLPGRNRVPRPKSARRKR